MPIINTFYFRTPEIKKEKKVEIKEEKNVPEKKSRFSGGLEAWRKAHANATEFKKEEPEDYAEEILAPKAVEIPGFPKAMKGVTVFKPTKSEIENKETEVSDKFDLAKLAKDMMDRRKRVIIKTVSNHTFSLRGCHKYGRLQH